MKEVFTEILDFTSGISQKNMKSEEIDKNLLWWSKRTMEEELMLTLSFEEIKNTLLMAVFVFNEYANLIVAAGIFQPRTWNESEPFFNGKKVVEIGTNFVSCEYRNQGIGRHLIDVRLNFSREKEWIPVSISSNKFVQKLFVKANGSLMEGDEDCLELRDLLCLKTRCKTDGQQCKCCPLIPGCGWIFK